MFAGGEKPIFYGIGVQACSRVELSGFEFDPQSFEIIPINKSEVFCREGDTYELAATSARITALKFSERFVSPNIVLRVKKLTTFSQEITMAYLQGRGTDLTIRQTVPVVQPSELRVELAAHCVDSPVCVMTTKP